MGVILKCNIEYNTHSQLKLEFYWMVLDALIKILIMLLLVFQYLEVYFLYSSMLILYVFTFYYDKFILDINCET